MRPYVKNAADSEQVKFAGIKVRKGREQELLDMQWILSEPMGRRFVWRYLQMCGVFKSSFTGSSETFFNEGQRNIGLRLLSDINEAHPDAYIMMMKENREEPDDRD